jgi:hypothetical protein
MALGMSLAPFIPSQQRDATGCVVGIVYEKQGMDRLRAIAIGNYFDVIVTPKTMPGHFAEKILAQDRVKRIHRPDMYPGCGRNQIHLLHIAPSGCRAAESNRNNHATLKLLRRLVWFPFAELIVSLRVHRGDADRTT